MARRRNQLKKLPCSPDELLVQSDREENEAGHEAAQCRLATLRYLAAFWAWAKLNKYKPKKEHWGDHIEPRWRWVWVLADGGRKRLQHELPFFWLTYMHGVVHPVPTEPNRIKFNTPGEAWHALFLTWSANNFHIIHVDP